MDIVGVLRGWKFFDHAGHLGGVLFAVYVDLSTVTDQTTAKMIICFNLCNIIILGCTTGGFIVCLKE